MLHLKKRFTSYVVLFILLNLLFVAYVEASPVIWDESYGGENSDFASAMVETSDGGFAIAGFTSSFGAGADDFYLVKTDASGNMLWNQTYGGEQYDAATAVVETSDGGLAMAGYTSSFGEGSYDFYLVKTDAYGNMLWNKTFGGADSDQAYSLIETSDGGLVLAGSTNSFGNGETDFFLVKTDSSGNMVWNSAIGSEESDGSVFGLVETSDGGIAAVGTTDHVDDGILLVKTNSSGNMLWNKIYENYGYAFSLTETSDGGLAIAGGSFNGGSLLCKGRIMIVLGTESQDFWLVKTDGSGNMLWNQTYGEGSLVYATALVEVSDGGFAVAGSTSSFGAGEDDFYLVRTDASGNMLWNQTYGGVEDDNAIALVEVSDGGFAVAGSTSSFGAGASDFYLIKTDENGSVPEFASWTIIPLMLAATVIIFVFGKHKKQSESKL